MKKIPIDNCSNCPHLNYVAKSSELQPIIPLGFPPYIPFCSKACKRLEYTVEGISPTRAIPLSTIPDWCPLPDDKANEPDVQTKQKSLFGGFRFPWG